MNVEKVLQAVDVDTSRNLYNNTNVLFLTYLFRGFSHLLHDDARILFTAAEKR